MAFKIEVGATQRHYYDFTIERAAIPERFHPLFDGSATGVTPGGSPKSETLEVLFCEWLVDNHPYDSTSHSPEIDPDTLIEWEES